MSSISRSAFRTRVLPAAGTTRADAIWGVRLLVLFARSCWHKSEPVDCLMAGGPCKWRLSPGHHRSAPICPSGPMCGVWPSATATSSAWPSVSIRSRRSGPWNLGGEPAQKQQRSMRSYVHAVQCRPLTGRHQEVLRPSSFVRNGVDQWMSPMSSLFGQPSNRCSICHDRPVHLL